MWRCKRAEVGCGVMLLREPRFPGCAFPKYRAAIREGSTAETDSMSKMPVGTTSIARLADVAKALTVLSAVEVRGFSAGAVAITQ